MKDKLLGVNPIKVLARELKDSPHEKKQEYIYQIKKAIQGPNDGVRYYHLNQSR